MRGSQPCASSERGAHNDREPHRARLLSECVGSGAGLQAWSAARALNTKKIDLRLCHPAC